MSVAPITELNAVKWTSENGSESELNSIASEVPLALVYNGEPFSVMMVSPLDLEEFVVGFSLTEHIVDKPEDIDGIEFVDSEKGISAYISVDKQFSEAMVKRRKNLIGRTGCGICGEETLEATTRNLRLVKDSKTYETEIIQRAINALSGAQTLNHYVGTLHGAAWADNKGQIIEVREDVGRHNALDKLIGAIATDKTDSKDGFVLITSRASYEMVSKVATANVGLLVAVSGPTSLAINTALDSGVTLIGFARDGRQTVYTHKHRVLM